MAETVLRDPLNLIRLIPAKETRENFLPNGIDENIIDIYVSVSDHATHIMCTPLVYVPTRQATFPK